MTIARALLLYLACPQCGKNLKQQANNLICLNRHRFEIVNGIPVFHKTTGNIHHQHQERYFNNFYSQYDRLPKLNWHQSYWQNAAADLAIAPGKLFADIGTGTGWLAIEAARAGCQVIAVDLTIDIIHRAKQFAQVEGVDERILFVVADAEHLPLSSGVVDYLAAVALIEHLPNHRRAAAEFSRVLGKGGKLWVVAPNELSNQPLIFKLIFKFWDQMLGHFRHYSPASLEKLFKPFGFRKQSVRYVGHLVKLWQFILQALLRNDRLWWYLDRFDRKQYDKPSSINVAVSFKKEH